MEWKKGKNSNIWFLGNVATGCGVMQTSPGNWFGNIVIYNKITTTSIFLKREEAMGESEKILKEECVRLNIELPRDTHFNV